MRNGDTEKGFAGAGDPDHLCDPEDAVHRALEAVQRDKVISGRPQVIRIEKN